MVLGVAFITIGVAAMTLITLRQNKNALTDTIAIPARVDYPAPSLSMTDLDGSPVALTDELGHVTLVNMWATWCAPCLDEMPTLQSFYDDHAGQGFVLIGLNDGELPADVRAFVDERNLAFPIWIDPTFSAEKAFAVVNLPSSFVIDRQGQIKLQWVGAISRELLDGYVVPIIEE